MGNIIMGVHVVVESMKSDGKAFRVLGGRPRILVDYALVLSLREVDKLGWSRMAEVYTKQTGQYISKDTMKRRYFEAKALEQNQDS
ncbi:hypothetical protein ACFLWR_00205 [Chloroflexota bacterium]